MPTPSPLAQLSTDGVTFGAPGVKIRVSASGTLYAQLDSIAGVDTTAWEVISTDETSPTSQYTLAVSGVKNNLCQFQVGAAGTAGLLQTTINSGVDKSTSNVDFTTTRTTIKWWVPANGNGTGEVGCVNEQMESDPVYGYSAIINSAVRAIDLLSQPSYAVIDTTIPIRGTEGDILAAWFALTSGSSLAGSGALRLTSAGQTAVAAQSAADSAHDVALLSINGDDGVVVGNLYALTVYLEVGANTLSWDGTNWVFSSGVTGPTIGQARVSGFGATAGQTMTVQAGAGQLQSGSNANNNGGPLVLAGGAQGTGGSGAAGTQGPVELEGNAITISTPSFSDQKGGFVPQTTTTGATITLLTVPMPAAGTLFELDYYVTAELYGDATHAAFARFARRFVGLTFSGGTYEGGEGTASDVIPGTPFASNGSSLVPGGVLASVSGSNAVVQAMGVATVTFASVMGTTVPPGFVSSGGNVYYTAGGTDSGSSGPTGTSSSQTVGTVTYKYIGTSPITIKWTLTRYSVDGPT